MRLTPGCVEINAGRLKNMEDEIATLTAELAEARAQQTWPARYHFELDEAVAAARTQALKEAESKVNEAIERWKEAMHTDDGDLYAECERALAALQPVRNDIAALAGKPEEPEREFHHEDYHYDPPGNAPVCARYGHRSYFDCLHYECERQRECAYAFVEPPATERILRTAALANKSEEPEREFHHEDYTYDPPGDAPVELVQQILDADARPPEATAKSAEEMFAYLDAPVEPDPRDAEITRRKRHER